MALINNYKEIISEIESKIKNKEDLDFIKQKITEISLIFLESIDKLSNINESQIKLESQVNKLQKSIKRIEEDIYLENEEDDNEVENECQFNCECGDLLHENEEEFEFEIVCPYCNFEFVTGKETNLKNEIECPKCHKIIELDWDDSSCSGQCDHCSNLCYDEDESDVEMSINEEDSKFKNESDNKKKNNNENEDDM